jgi:undecaprenyl diphosphate synthase
MNNASEEHYRLDFQDIILKDNRRISKEGIPKHVAIIMDGNGRWAKSQGQDRIQGHKAGAETVRMLVEESRKLGIENLTLFAFSTENWQRPTEEVTALMTLFKQYLTLQLDLMCRNGIVLKLIGQRNRLPEDLQTTVEQVEEKTKIAAENFKKEQPHLNNMNLILAISYGGRAEIVDTTKAIARDIKIGKIDLEQISEELFEQYLYTANIPDPDLLIRTSNEHRISNFLLWQLAYTEIYVTKTNWPEFSVSGYLEALYEYTLRERRFGLV